MFPSQQGILGHMLMEQRESSLLSLTLKLGGFPGPLGGPRVVLRVLKELKEAAARGVNTEPVLPS